MVRFRPTLGGKPSSQCLGIMKHEDNARALGRGQYSTALLSLASLLPLEA